MNSTSSPGLLQDSKSLSAGEALIAVPEPETLQMWPDRYKTCLVHETVEFARNAIRAAPPHRVVFERGFAANMMAIDGTWRRPCTMEDVSETGARLTVDGSIEGLPLKEFFLLLSTVGKAYRRSQLAWVNGNQVGVYFLRPGEKKKKS